MMNLTKIAVVLTAICLPTAAAGGEFRAGAAKVDITPAVGVSLDGSISKNGPVTSIHDPLHARALVLDDGQSKIAIVVVDQCMTAREVFDRAKAEVSNVTDIRRDRMLMAATHTHAAPRTIHIGREPVDDQYHQDLSKKIAAAVVTANHHLAPAEIGFGSFTLPDLIACRRFLCEPGSVGKNPFGELGEQIKSVAGSSTRVIRPAGPVDPQFSVISVRHVDGSPICVLGNFSVHYCGGYQRGAVSADYFGYYGKAIESALSSDIALNGKSSHPPVIGIMSNGTSGNTGAFTRGGKKRAPFEAIEYYGRTLADQSIDAIDAIDHHRNVTIDMLEKEIELAVRKPTDARLAWAEQVLSAKEQELPHRWSKVYAQETRHLGQYADTEKLILQTIRIGDIAIASAPCEVFAETGLAIKNASPFASTFNMELANGYGGYLPPREQHELGGYETWPARSSFLEIGAEETIRNELGEMLRTMAVRRPLWSGAQIPDDLESIPFVDGVVHRTIHTASEDGYKFLHGAAIIEHNGTMYANWANSPTNENGPQETLQGRRSTDGGETWSEIEIIGPGFEGPDRHSHGVLLVHEDQVWTICSRFGIGTSGRRFPGLKAEAFVLGEDDRWHSKGIVMDNCWPYDQPVQMPNGNFITGGQDKDGLPVVAVSNRDDLTDWQTVHIPYPKQLAPSFAETTVWSEAGEVTAIIRGGAGVAWISRSFDGGMTWNHATMSNLPMPRAKAYLGKLSSGQLYLLSNLKNRDTLAISVGEPGATSLSRMYRIRHGKSIPPRFPGKAKGKQWSYPYGYEHDGKLYVVYSIGKEDCGLSILPIESLSAK